MKIRLSNSRAFALLGRSARPTCPLTCKSVSADKPITNKPAPPTLPLFHRHTKQLLLASKNQSNPHPMPIPALFIYGGCCPKYGPSVAGPYFPCHSSMCFFRAAFATSVCGSFCPQVAGAMAAPALMLAYSLPPWGDSHCAFEPPFFPRC